LKHDSAWDATFATLDLAKEYSENVFAELQAGHGEFVGKYINWVYVHDLVSGYMSGHWSGIGWIAYMDVPQKAHPGSMWVYETSSDSAYKKTVALDCNRDAAKPDPREVQTCFMQLRNWFQKESRYRYVDRDEAKMFMHGFFIGKNIAPYWARHMSDGVLVVYSNWINGFANEAPFEDYMDYLHKRGY